MKQNGVQGALPAKHEKIELEHSYRVRFRFFAVFMICCGVLLAAFAVSALWYEEGGGSWLGGFGPFGSNEKDTTETDGEETESSPETEEESTAPADPIPNGATPIVSADLSAPSLGKDYIHNETKYAPDVESLLAVDVSMGESGDGPKVLILHTHTGESYLPSGTGYIEGAVGDLTHSREDTENVVAVGRVLCDTLNEKGITAIHCTVMHDDPTYSGSYARSAETIKQYLELYPSIEYVIDLHRDSITNSDGELIRTEAGGADVAMSQVMAVVGTDVNGTVHDGWEGNLALALQLREALNMEVESLCRPVSLRNASYNQEIAKFSLLLEIGSCANSVEEACRTAVAVGTILAELIQER